MQIPAKSESSYTSICRAMWKESAQYPSFQVPPVSSAEMSGASLFRRIFSVQRCNNYLKSSNNQKTPRENNIERRIGYEKTVEECWAEFYNSCEKILTSFSNVYQRKFEKKYSLEWSVNVAIMNVEIQLARIKDFVERKIRIGVQLGEK